jgi:hypothetical protein
MARHCRVLAVVSATLICDAVLCHIHTKISHLRRDSNEDDYGSHSRECSPAAWDIVNTPICQGERGAALGGGIGGMGSVYALLALTPILLANLFTVCQRRIYPGPVRPSQTAVPQVFVPACDQDY